MKLDRRRLLRSLPVVAVLGGTLVAGAGIGYAAAGWTMEAHVQAQYAAFNAHGCPYGTNCTAPAPPADWPEFQAGAQMVALGELEIGLGAAVAVGGAATWRLLRARRSRGAAE